MNHLSDERGSKPSASAAKANRLCNGRHAMCAPLEDVESELAHDGILQHLWMEDNSTKLRDELLPACQQAKEQHGRVVGLIWSDWESSPPEVYLENRLWYREKRFSGKADYVGIKNKRALIIDYKFGRVKVDDASRNEQLIWLAVLVFANFEVDAITVAIIQPHCGPPHLHTYNKRELRLLRNRVLALVRRIDSPHPALRAGTEQCRYCKALHICPAVEGKRDAIARIDTRQVTALSNTHLVGLLASLPAVKKLCERIEAEAISRLRETPDAIAGYELRAGNKSRSVTDPGKAAPLLEASGLLDAEGLYTTFSMRMGQLVKVVAEYNEIGPKAARAEIERVLGDVLVVREGKERVCRIES
jgi:hypothetical protein